MKKILFMFVVFLLVYGSVRAQNSFSYGEELFMNNKPDEALKYLEAAVVEDPAFVKAHLYLGIVYIQLRRLDDAITIYKRILPRAGNDTALIAYNLGNAYFIKGQPAFAQQFYSQAIDMDGTFASAYLNRANSLIRSGAVGEAVPDYQQFLMLEPQSPKKPQIERLITFIRDEIAAEEQRKQLAEELARQEEERRRQLLDDITASLQAASTESQGVSAGSEDVLGYEGEFELE
ncbi:MAG: tetratricopeptide repeat protein [Treponema sp.]|jgi:tetratricopeptide (TPR) repeat protein|nr:tetratricopeptide repeat protein [Treponema sp.]